MMARMGGARERFWVVSRVERAYGLTMKIGVDASS
jgi:hypothetical protein